MKRIVIILIGLISVAYGQSSPTSSKTRFVNGLYVGTKLDSYFSAADSNAIYWRADSALMAKYKGTARALAFAVSGGYIPYSDTTSLLSQVVRTFGTQTIGGNKTFSNDIVVNGLTVGRGAGSIAGNTAIGLVALGSNTTGTTNTAIGNASQRNNEIGTYNSSLGNNSSFSNINGGFNTGIGAFALQLNTVDSNTAVGALALGVTSTGRNNTAIGYASGARPSTSSTRNTTGSQNTFIGALANGSASGNTNETVIGYNATGNGSNTVTIGNSSVTDNYFNGNVRASGNVQTTNGTVNTILSFGTGIGSVGTNTNHPLVLLANASEMARLVPTTGAFSVGGAGAPQGTLHVGNANSGIIVNESSSIAQIVGTNRAGTASQELFLKGFPLSFTGNGGGGAKQLGLNSSGQLTDGTGVYATTVGATNRDLYIDDTGLFGYVSSFRASKKNIVPISNADWLHSLNPVTFNYRIKDSTGNYTDSAYKELEYGLIAEEVEPINKEMVFYDVDSSGNKKLRGVHYSKLIIPLLAEVKEHKKRIDAQDKLIEALLQRIITLEAKLN